MVLVPLVPTITDGNPISDANEIADTFNNYFISCSTVDTQQSQSTTQFVEYSSLHSMGLLPPDNDEILSLITLLSCNCAPGHDGIRPSVIKALKLQIVPILCHLV